MKRMIPGVMLNGVPHSIEFACKHEAPWGVSAEVARARVADGWSVAGAILLPEGETAPRVPPPLASPKPPRKKQSRSPRVPVTAVAGSGRPLVTEGVTFPDGTCFLYRRGEAFFEGRVVDGFLVVGGNLFTTLSPPLSALAGRPINGWLRWWVARPGDTGWRLAKTLRAGPVTP